MYNNSCFSKILPDVRGSLPSLSVTPTMADDSPPSGVTNGRRSARLMQSANPMAEASNNQQPSKRAKKSGQAKESEKPEERLYLSCRNPKNIGRLGVHIKLDVEKMAPKNAHIVNGCATLAIQDYAIQNSQNWRDWRLLKIVEVARVMVSGFRYYITFEADNGHGVHHTFQADVWDSIKFGRRTNGFRTLKPRRSKWYSGNLWIPLTRSTFYIQPSSTDVQEPGIVGFRGGTIKFEKKGLPKPKNNLLSPPERMGEDSRNTYNEAKKSDEILAQVSAPVKLELEKLSDGDIDILKGCATLAMHDHLIQTVGSIARTLEAEVFDGLDQRRVRNLRAIKPDITDWYTGKLWIPI
ncbi:hypothetical protein TSUD_184390 [Trifolium subterraneum]|uniref:Cystatin domain-containing protein n=1 Tax=Trifolium subterraneum TaxID=3900 RepID=A0A2Z6PTZ6_TRISU|nr:hypothetical protein TSUD_184390 [Trifolium subterraneum]